MPRSSRRPRRAARAGTLRLFLVLAMLVGINVYFLGLRGGTSIGALLRTAHLRGGPAPLEPAGPADARLPALPEDPPGAHLVEGVLADGQTIAQALAPRLGHARAASLEKVLGTRADLTGLHAGQAYTLVFDIDGRLAAFELRVSPTLAYHIELGGHRSAPRVSTIDGRAETRIVGLSLPAGPPLWEALRRSGEGAAAGERIAELFADEGELTGATVSPGEHVRALVEKHLVGGRLLRYGRVVAAEWSSRAGVHRAFFWPGVPGGYYTERGEAVERRVRLAPFRALRGDSPSRRDPPRALRTEVTRGSRAGTLPAMSPEQSVATRLTVDIPVPTGGGAAVACASADGALAALSRTPTGTSITLDIEGGRLTYANLTHLAPGLRIGQHVHRGQALGRVEIVLGVTCEGVPGPCDGTTAGPRTAALPSSERPRYGELIAPLLERLRELAARPHDRLAAGPLSAIP